MFSWLRLFFLWLFLLTPALTVEQAAATGYVLVPGPDGFVDVSPYLEILEDKDHRLGITDVVQPQMANEFRRHRYPVPNLGFSTSAFWIRLKLESQSQFANRLYLELAWPPADYIDLYDLSEKGLRPREGGELRFYNLREVQHRNHVFVLDFAPREKKTIYLKLVTESVVVMPITVYDPDIFHQQDRQDQFLYGIYFGIFIILAFYNLLIFLSLRERIYLHYMVFLLLFGSYMLVYKGFTLEIFWPHWQHFNNLLNPILLSLLVAATARFIRSYLDIRSGSVHLDAGLRYLMYAALLHTPTIALQGYHTAIRLDNLLLFLTILLSLSASVVSMWQKKPLASYMFFSTMAMMLSGLIAILGNFAFLPNMILSLFGMQVMSVLGALSLSFGLAYRMNLMRLDRDRQRATLSRITDDFAIARRIQINILPAELPSSEYYEIEASYLPKYDLGGDFYDYRVIDRGRLSAIIADVTGHGVSAALFASMLKIAYAHEGDVLTDPAELLNRIDASLRSRLGNHFITAAAICLDSPRGTLFYAHAGHPPILHYQRDNGVIVELKGRGPAIGLMERRACEPNQQEVHPGDRLLLFTDGITELRSASGELYSVERLKETMLKHAQKNAADFKLELLRQLAQHKGDLPVADDITFLIIDIPLK